MTTLFRMAKGVALPYLVVVTSSTVSPAITDTFSSTQKGSTINIKNVVLSAVSFPNQVSATNTGLLVLAQIFPEVALETTRTQVLSARWGSTKLTRLVGSQGVAGANAPEAAWFGNVGLNLSSAQNVSITTSQSAFAIRVDGFAFSGVDQTNPFVSGSFISDATSLSNATVSGYAPAKSIIITGAAFQGSDGLPVSGTPTTNWTTITGITSGGSTTTDMTFSIAYTSAADVSSNYQYTHAFTGGDGRCVGGMAVKGITTVITSSERGIPEPGTGSGTNTPNPNPGPDPTVNTSFVMGIGRLEGGSAQGDLKSEYGTAIAMTAWQTGRLLKVGYQSQGTRGPDLGGNSYGRGNAGRYTMDIYASKNDANKSIDWDNKIGTLDNAYGYYEPGTLVGVAVTADFSEMDYGHNVGWLRLPMKSTADGQPGVQVAQGDKIWMVRRNIAADPTNNFCADNHMHQFKIAQPDQVSIGGDSQGYCYSIGVSAQSKTLNRDYRKRPLYAQQFIGQTDFYGSSCYLAQTLVDDTVTGTTTKTWGSIRTIFNDKTNSALNQLARQKFQTSANFTERTIKNVWIHACIREGVTGYTDYTKGLEFRILEGATVLYNWTEIPASQFGVTELFHVEGGLSPQQPLYKTINGVQYLNILAPGHAVLSGSGFLMQKSQIYTIELRVNPANKSTIYYINASQHSKTLVNMDFRTMLTHGTNCRAEYSKNNGSTWPGWAYRVKTTIAQTDPLEQRSDLVLGIFMTP